MIVEFKKPSKNSKARPISMPKAMKWELYRAIRDHCIECMGGQRIEVTYCSSPECSLYKYRPYQERK